MKSAPAAVTDAILDLVLHAPTTTEQALQDPRVRAHKIGRAAARKASLMSGTMSLPPGMLGWLTVLPELIGVWRLQAQMVSDLSAVYGQRASLGREQMLYCLFKHVSAQLLRDVVVRVGERVVLREASLKMLQSLAQQLGVHVTKAMLSRSASRFVPLLGAMGVGAYAYFDTMQVAKNAMELFGHGPNAESTPATSPNQKID